MDRKTYPNDEAASAAAPDDDHVAVEAVGNVEAAAYNAEGAGEPNAAVRRGPTLVGGLSLGRPARPDLGSRCSAAAVASSSLLRLLGFLKPKVSSFFV